jgi:uncharacterized protein (DUF924 family)
MSADWRGEVLEFWFALKPEQWWRREPALDHRIRQDFLELWSEKRQLPVGHFLADPRSALAAVILFDQFPRNMFRDSDEQFATDHLALAIAGAAVDRGFDAQLEQRERSFLYMPFQHSENIEDQNRSVLLFTGIDDGNYAKKHRDIIARFGRFPHRNAVLRRTPRPAELAAGDVAPW